MRQNQYAMTLELMFGVLTLLVLLAPQTPIAIDYHSVATTVNPPEFLMLGSPSLHLISGTPAVQVSYRDNYTCGCDIAGIVYLVARNLLGQTVYYSTASMVLTDGQLGTTYLFIPGFPAGTALTNFIFVVTPQGVVISNSARYNITIPSPPVSVVSVTTGPFYPPSGPIINVTLDTNFATQPVTSLTAILSLIGRNVIFQFSNVTSSTPLMPNETISQTVSVIGPGGSGPPQSSYPMTITGTLLSGKPFRYVVYVQIVYFR